MALSKRLRFKILTRDRFRCRYCGRSAPSVELQVDHVNPVSLGGTDDESNLVSACVECNASKSGKLLPIDSRTELETSATLPHVDRCRRCLGMTLCAAEREMPSRRGYLAFYRCAAGHEWKTWWAAGSRMTPSAVADLTREFQHG